MALPSLPSLPLRCTQPHMPPARQQLCSSPHCSAATPAAAAPPCGAGRAFPGPEPAWNSEPRRQHPLGTQECRPGAAPSSGQPGARPRRARGEIPGQDTGGADCGSSWGPLARCWGPLRLPKVTPASCDLRLAAGGPRAGARPGPPGAPGPRSSSRRQRQGASGGERRPLQWDVRPARLSQHKAGGGPVPFMLRWHN